MKLGLYPRLAFTGIRKNKKVYLPYILTAIGMVMMFYIISFIAADPGIGSLENGWQFQVFLSFGQYVIGLFACIFLFYTNSFLVRQRKKEFGLYNILGMGKGNLVKILFWETLIIAFVTIVGGLLTGLLFSRAVQLLIARFMGEGQMVAYRVLFPQMKMTFVLFALLFFFLFLCGVRQIYKAKPIELLHSEAVGEKPPKANWIMAFMGLVLLGIGYTISITLANFNMTKMLLITLAIILVIIATYILFIAGSVAFCRLIQKNKNYYYKTNHFVSVSSMVYRMKRNGAGLATICVLCIMVLVILSTTVCLYIGKEDGLRKMYPRDIVVDVTFTGQVGDWEEGFIQNIHETARQALTNQGVQGEDLLNYRFTQVATGLVNNQAFIQKSTPAYAYSNMAQIFIISLEDYNRLMGTSETLGDKQALLYAQKAKYPYDTLEIEGYETLNIVKQVPQMLENGQGYISIYPYLYVVVSPAEKALLDDFLYHSSTSGQIVWSMNDYYGFNLPLEAKEQIEFEKEITRQMSKAAENLKNNSSLQIKGTATKRMEIYGMYGAIMVLGGFLSVVFLMATVLTMYYKQVTEGYEDQKRYEIMQKVGMTPKEVKKTINSQVLTVFFLPLVVAGIHLIAAFNMIKVLLELIGVMNTGLLMQVTLISFLVFALFYTLMYLVTSKAYYTIVSAKE